MAFTNESLPAMSVFRTRFALVLLCFVGVGLTSTVQAQQFRNPALSHVTWTTMADPATVAQGQATRIVFSASISKGAPEDGPWKMYALGSPSPSRAVRVTFDDFPAGLAQEGDLQQTGAKEGFDPNFKKVVVYFEKQAILWADVAVAADAEVGARTVTAEVTFQICNDRICLPPTKIPLAATLDVTMALSDGSDGASAALAQPPVVPPVETPLLAADSLTGLPLAQIAPGVGEGGEDTGDAANEELAATFAAPTADFGGGGLWGFLLLALGAGFAALLTPCVFPMIPLTVSFFTKHADKDGQPVRMALVYGLAIVVTFTGLGVLMAVLVGAAGAQSFAANPWVNLFIGLIFVLFALSLLGLFELRLPSGFINFFNRKGSEAPGYLGVFFMGFTLTLVSFSCTAPFVGGLLAATTMGSWSYPILGMIVFSAAFSLPFMFFAMFPRALDALPQSGSWMNVVKVVLGFVELAAALKFLSNADLVWGWSLISRTLAIALTIVIFTLTGMYLIGKLRLKHEPALEQVGVGRLMTSMVFFGLALYLIPGLLGAPLNKLDAYLPPRQSDDVSLLPLFGGANTNTVHNDDAWITDDIEAAFAQAEADGKPVMIDFTGYTCTNCREMEANVFTRPEIADRFTRNFVLLRLYTDGPRDTEFQQYQLDLTGTVALPTYAVVNPSDQKKTLVQVSGVVPLDRFASFLDRGKASYIQQNLALGE